MRVIITDNINSSVSGVDEDQDHWVVRLISSELYFLKNIFQGQKIRDFFIDNF